MVSLLIDNIRNCCESDTTDDNTKGHSTEHNDNRDGAHAGDYNQYTAGTTTMTHGNNHGEGACGVGL